ncbi:MAG: SpoIIE family protein phosphatase [Clostridia bacterium]|nr:SpoIIE family protein phosphatase [Clostridia bacterium]
MPKLQKASLPVTKLLRKPNISDCVPLLLLFLAARCSCLGISPFATAMFASVFDLSIGLPGIAAVMLGLVSVGTAGEGAKYITAMVLFWMYSILKPEKRESSSFSSVITGLLLIISGAVTMTYTGFTYYKLMLLLTEGMVCAFLYILFEKAALLFTYSRRAPTEQELISGAVCIGIFISGLSDITVPPGLNLAKIISSYAIMTIALSLPLSVAGSCGVATGLICNMDNPGAVTLMGLYGISAIFSNLLKGFGKYGAALGFLGGCALVLLFSGNLVSIPAFEIVAAAILFIITPDKLHKSAALFMNRTARADFVCPETKMREYLSHRLADASTAFSRLAGIYKSATQKRIHMYNKDICTVIDNTVNRVCRYCPHFGECLHNERVNTYRIMFNILEIIENSGFCVVSNAPPEFTRLCKRQEIFLCEFAHSYELFKRDAVKQGEFVNNRDLLLRQYEEISELFARFHDEICSGFRLVPELEEKVASELLKSGVSPRDVRVFESENGETEVFMSVNKHCNREFLAKKASAATGLSMEYTNTAQGGLMRFCPSPVYDVEFGMMQLAKDNSAVTGDSITSFRTGSDRFYVILCDGMGNGAEASRESRITLRLLEELLRDGFSAKTAIETVNSSLAMGVEKECFSSVDLLSVNLITGSAEFYKIGGSKSFIKRDNSVETVFSPSLPVGILPEVHISCITKRLEDGDIVVMLSDGAESNSPGFLSGEKLRKIISDEEKTMDDVAEAILNGSRVKSIKPPADDMTVAAIRMYKK